MDAARVAALLQALLERAGPAAPLLLFLASFVEYVFPPFPGDLMVVLGAWFATHGALSWPLAFAATTAGALCGAAVDWRVGRWMGGRLDERAGAGRLFGLDRAQLERFEAAYRRWGGWLLVANRFLPGVRAFFFLAAGASRLPLWKVLLYGGLSAAAWNALLLAAGAFAARNVGELVSIFERFTNAAWVALAVAVLAGAAVWRWRRKRRAS